MMNKFYIQMCLFATLSLVPFVGLRAQKNDYVITTQGDTLYGSISQIKLTSIKFKPKGKGKAETIYSPQAKEFRKIDQVFETKELPHNSLRLFLERIEAGSISLYRYHALDNSSKLPNMAAPGGTFTPNGTYIPSFSNSNYYDQNILRLYASKNDGPLVEIRATRNDVTSSQQRDEALEELISDDPELLQELNSSLLNFVNLRTLIKKYNKRASL